MKNDVKEIQKVLKKVRRKLVSVASYEKDLCGWCALASYIIFYILKKKGYKPYFCANDEHAFIRWKKYYADVTITQFNKSDKKFPSIYFDRKPADNHWHRINHKTQNGKKIWRNICRDWNQPLDINSPFVKELIESN